MSCNLPLSTIGPTERRNDLHLTTAGAGHMYHKPLPAFPNFTSLRTRPLPFQFTARAQYNELYNTGTSTTAQDYIYRRQLENNTVYEKPQSLIKVNYLADTARKLEGTRPWSKSLTMSNQQSETHDKYRGLPIPDELIMKQLTESPVDRAILNDSSQKAAAEPAASLKGKALPTQNQSILEHNEHYMTTNNWHHKKFSERELKRYPKKDAATYWLCENYPKAWGFGTNENPMTTTSRTQTSSDPILDRLTFRSSAKTNTPKSATKPNVRLVTNSLVTQYSASYQNISKEKKNELFKRLAEPAIIRTEKDLSFLETVPKMYQTFNMTYGSHSK